MGKNKKKVVRKPRARMAKKAAPASVPVPVPPEALAALRDLQRQIDTLVAQKNGILIGMASTLGLSRGTICDISTGLFVDAPEPAAPPEEKPKD